MKLRKYQRKAVKALINASSGSHPIVVAPTGSGKTLILCGYIKECLDRQPDERILVVSHVEDILRQDYNAIKKYFHNVSCGLYSAGLKHRTIENITVAGIQSIYRKAEYFSNFSKIIVDECHLINHKSQGMYRKFLEGIDAQYIGLTATPWRLGHGRICEGDDALFTDVAYDISNKDNYNKLIKQGYLCDIVGRKTVTQLDPTDISVRGGDYADDALSKAFDRAKITNRIVTEIIKSGKKYHKWLIFAIDIKHAEHISARLNKLNIMTVCIHSQMSQDRKIAIEKFRSGKYRCAVNVNILTTGIDIPNIDLVATLCPTASVVKHVQSTGRGGRPAPDKKHCLFLDFAGNTERLGPINDIFIEQKRPRKGLKIEPIMKACPVCRTYAYPAQRKCHECGHEFEFKNKLEAKSSNIDIIKRVNEKTSAWYDVKRVMYGIHSKPATPDSLMVTYQVGLVSVSEWVCLNHKGYAHLKAKQWVSNRISFTKKVKKAPKTTAELYEISRYLRTPKRIFIINSGRFPNIAKHEF